MKVKKLIAHIAASAVMLGGLASVAPAASADTDNDFEFEVTGTSHGEATADTSLTNSTLAQVGGNTQVLWEESNYNAKLTRAAVKEAWGKRITVIATGANSSQVIYRMSGRRKLAILKPGSKVRNTGRHNNRRVGFVWTIKRPAIVKYDKRSGQYRHAADLLTKYQLNQLQKTVNKHKYRVVGKIRLGGKVYFIVIWCGNYIGGNVVMIPHVTQVRFKEDLVIESDAESVAKTGVTFDFKVTCPSNGATFNVQGFAWAYGKASSKITYSQRTRATVVGALEYKAKQSIRINQNTEADAQASVTIKGSCGGNNPPPPPVDNPPVINIYGAPAHLYTGGTAALWIEASDADNDALQVSVKAAGDNTCEQVNGKYTTNCVTGLIPVDIRWDGTPCPAGVKCYRATAWAGATPGTFKAIATVSAGGKTVSNDVSFPIVRDEF